MHLTWWDAGEKISPGSSFSYLVTIVLTNIEKEALMRFFCGIEFSLPLPVVFYSLCFFSLLPVDNNVLKPSFVTLPRLRPHTPTVRVFQCQELQREHNICWKGLTRAQEPLVLTICLRGLLPVAGQCKDNQTALYYRTQATKIEKARREHLFGVRRKTQKPMLMIFWLTSCTTVHLNTPWTSPGTTPKWPRNDPWTIGVSRINQHQPLVKALRHYFAYLDPHYPNIWKNLNLNKHRAPGLTHIFTHLILHINWRKYHFFNNVILIFYF